MYAYLADVFRFHQVPGLTIFNWLKSKPETRGTCQPWTRKIVYLHELDRHILKDIGIES